MTQRSHTAERGENDGRGPALTVLGDLVTHLESAAERCADLPGLVATAAQRASIGEMLARSVDAQQETTALAEVRAKISRAGEQVAALRAELRECVITVKDIQSGEQAQALNAVLHECAIPVKEPQPGGSPLVVQPPSHRLAEIARALVVPTTAAARLVTTAAARPRATSSGPTRQANAGGNDLDAPRARPPGIRSLLALSATGWVPGVLVTWIAATATVCTSALLVATPRDDLLTTIIVITLAVESIAALYDWAARGRAAIPAGTARSTTAHSPVPARHADLLSSSPSPAAQTSRASGTAAPSRDGPDPQDVIEGVQGLMRGGQFVRARVLIHQHLGSLCAVDTPADPLMVLRAARTAVRCDPRGFDPATLPWAWRYYRYATRRHGPGHPMSGDAARRLVVILRAGGHAAQLAAFYREAGDDYDAFRLYDEALRVRISAAQILHQMGRCATALRRLDRSTMQWHDATGAARVDVAVVLAMLHLPIVCGHPRQARRMLRQLPVLPPPPDAVHELLLGFHHGITDVRDGAGHRGVCAIAAPGSDSASELRVFLAELRVAVAGLALAELIDDDYLGHVPPRLSARERIAVRTGRVALRTKTLARKLRCGVAEVERIVHAAADAGQSRLISSSPSSPVDNPGTADRGLPRDTRLSWSGIDTGPQQVRPVLEGGR